MAEIKVSLTGKNGVFALIVVVGLAGFRFLSLSSFSDSELEKKLLIELQDDRGREAQALLDENQDEDDLSELAAEMQKLARERPVIHSLAVSKPLLSLSSSAKAVVKVEFSLPGRSQRTIRYYKAKDSVVGGWTIGTETTMMSFYLNLI